MSLFAFTVTGALALAPVDLRGGETLDAPIAAVGPQGVEVGGEAPRTIPWDRVKRVRGEGAEQFAAHEKIAEDAWRARTRLERGDAALAEPLFESLFARFADTSGPTAELVCQGLLLCRLDRGAVIEAIRPWLESVRQLSDGAERRTWPFGAPSVDERTLLSPLLPPLWLDGPALNAYLRTQRATPASEGSPLAAALESWYRFSARAVGGASEPPPEIPPDLAAHPGLLFVSRIVLADVGAGNDRLKARDALQGHIERHRGAWSEAWAHVAIGRSLLDEASPDIRADGMNHLLQVPARFGSSQPYLAGLALAEVGAAMARDGDEEASSKLLEQLETLYPGHPGIEWLRSERAAIRSQQEAEDAI